MTSETVALIGYGAIAQAILASSRASDAPQITHVIVRSGTSEDIQSQLPKGCMAIETVSALPPETGFVLECAGHEAVRVFGPACLELGFDFGVISVGALADPQTHANLAAAAATGGARAVILPGAIGGIDAISAAGPALTHVRYVSRKPPASWRGSPAENEHDLTCISKPTTLFAGPARRAALEFPKNANVVATVALAGIGFEKTEVTLLADPGATGNTHEIIASGGGYDFHYITSGAALAANPRTSALTAQSALRAIRQRGTGITI